MPSELFPTDADSYYWTLTLKDGTTLAIPPSAVSVVKRKLEAREPVNTTNQVILYSEIKGFEKSSRRYTAVPLLEEVAQAFREPMVTDDNAIKARWVKKEVTTSEYEKYYSKNGAYRKLGGDSGLVMIAFVVPTHLIDTNRMDYVTKEEERKLA